MSRRRTSIAPTRSSANEFPKTVELEQRLSRLEVCCREFADTLRVIQRQINALQANLDFVSANIGRQQP